MPHVIMTFLVASTTYTIANFLPSTTYVYTWPHHKHLYDLDQSTKLTKSPLTDLSRPLTQFRHGGLKYTIKR